MTIPPPQRKPPPPKKKKEKKKEHVQVNEKKKKGDSLHSATLIADIKIFTRFTFVFLILKKNFLKNPDTVGIRLT